MDEAQIADVASSTGQIGDPRICEKVNPAIITPKEEFSPPDNEISNKQKTMETEGQFTPSEETQNIDDSKKKIDEDDRWADDEEEDKDDIHEERKNDADSFVLSRERVDVPTKKTDNSSRTERKQGLSCKDQKSMSTGRNIFGDRKKQRPNSSNRTSMKQKTKGVSLKEDDWGKRTKNSSKLSDKEHKNWKFSSDKGSHFESSSSYASKNRKEYPRHSPTSPIRSLRSRGDETLLRTSSKPSPQVTVTTTQSEFKKLSDQPKRGIVLESIMGCIASNSVSSERNVSIFGHGRPREDVLKEKEGPPHPKDQG